MSTPGSWALRTLIPGLWTFDETVLKETGGEKYERYARAYDEYMESSFIGMMGAEDETGEEICTGMMM